MPLVPNSGYKSVLKKSIALKQNYCDLPLSANVSTEVVLAAGALVKKVPIFLPAMMNVIAFSCIPLQMTTDTPLFSAHVAAWTWKPHYNITVRVYPVTRKSPRLGVRARGLVFPHPSDSILGVRRYFYREGQIEKN